MIETMISKDVEVTKAPVAPEMKEFFKVVDAVGVDDQPIQVKQSIGKFSKEMLLNQKTNLQLQMDEVDAKLAEFE